VLNGEKLDETGARLDTPQKSMRHLTQETSISKSSAAKVTKLLQHQLLKAPLLDTNLEIQNVKKIHYFLRYWEEEVVGADQHTTPGTTLSDSAYFSIKMLSLICP
jgi:hypothetical protein